jgi:hypothetical protein
MSLTPEQQAANPQTPSNILEILLEYSIEESFALDGIPEATVGRDNFRL